MTIVWNAQRVSEGLKEIDSARPVVLANVKSLLDEYHKAEKSPRYYDILLGDWVERYLHLIYVAIQQLATGSAERNQQGEILKKVKVTAPTDTAEFFASHQSLPEVVLAVLQSVTFGGADSVDISESDVIVRNSSLPGRRDKIVSKLLRLISVKRTPKILFVKPFSGNLPNSWISTMFSWRKWASHDDLQFAYSVRATVDSRWRSEKLLNFRTDAPLAEIANSMLTAFLPVCAVEAFSGVRTKVNRARPNRVGHLYSSQALWANFTFKLLAAEWCELGTKLHYHQHGGWYGLDESHVAENYESRVADFYYTWGWSRGTSNTKPLSPVAIDLHPREKTFDSLICFDQPKQIYRLQYFPLPGTLQTMYEQTAEFVKTRESSNQLKIRLFPGEFGKTQQKAITDATPKAIFDGSMPIAEQYSASRIVIHNYVGTSWLETLGNNIPTICFYDVDAYRFREDAKELLEELVRVKILHLSGSSAAEHANSIDNDINLWWLSEEVQTARKNFAKEFANYSPEWKRTWQENFQSMIGN